MEQRHPPLVSPIRPESARDTTCDPTLISLRIHLLEGDFGPVPQPAFWQIEVTGDGRIPP
ncbi:MAG: hypothetical protein ACRDRW_11605 [Pseudonocardiaceae bacterium]